MISSLAAGIANKKSAGLVYLYFVLFLDFVAEFVLALAFDLCLVVVNLYFFLVFPF